MTTKANWDSLLTGTINGKAVDQTSNANAWAMGSPTLDLWVNSWNATYPSDTLYTATTSEAMSDGLNGYYIGTSANPSDYNVYLSDKAGYNNILYWISKGEYYGCANEQGVEGYFLASPSAQYEGLLLSVRSTGSGEVGGGDAYGNMSLAIRPVICLPSNIVNQ